MRLLVKQAIVVDKNSSFANQKVDVFIEDGLIKRIAKNINESADKVIESENLHLSVGWFELKAEMGEPGMEHKESVISLLTAAAAGGFSDVVTLPNTVPVADNSSVLEYIKKQAVGQVPNLHVSGAASVGNMGVDMTELFDMHSSNAVYFTDGHTAIQNADLLKRLLQYGVPHDLLIAQFPQDSELTRNGVMNEGKISTSLGLKGIPELAENVMVGRDLEILRYTGGKLHFIGISSPSAFKAIVAARAERLDVSCDVNLNNLVFSDKQLQGFESNYKVIPPLRSTDSKEELIELVIENKDWVILSSDHSPQVIEDKLREFDHAEFGTIGLQTFYSLYNGFLSSKIEPVDFVQMVSTNPRKRLNQKQYSIEEGELANLALFDPSVVWIFNASSNYSKSANSPFYNKDLEGKVLALINGENFFID